MLIKKQSAVIGPTLMLVLQLHRSGGTKMAQNTIAYCNLTVASSFNAVLKLKRNNVESR